MRSLTLAFALVSLLVLLSGLAQAAQDRYALVIGNAAYTNERPLVNTLNDAQDLAAKLKGLGFEVRHEKNLGNRQMRRVIHAFLDRVARRDGVALVYFSGHALQDDSRSNYLLPVDAHIESKTDIPAEGFSVSRILESLGERDRRAVNLVVLDACRNNPFSTKTRSSSKGLNRVSPSGGTLVLYAASPNQEASDNPAGRNGLFTQHLLAEIGAPGVHIEDAFRRAARSTAQASDFRQEPYFEGNLYEPFYLAGLGKPVAPAVVTPTPAQTVQPNLELEIWRSAEGCGTQLCLQAYLDKYPQGVFAAIARARIAALTEQPAAVVAAPAADEVLKEQLKQCEVHLAANRLTTGQGGTALDCYREVLARQPGNAQAQAGLDRIVDRYIGWGRAALERGDVARAKGHLDKALQVQPGSEAALLLGEAIAAKETALAQAREREAQAAAERRRQAEAQRARDQAQAAERHRDTTLTGELVAIPGGCFQMGSPA